ncbi:chemotaxis protein CheW [Dactylosporangium sp. McL0621]|uniref:chemotaxis protein CheW n=1 Tax=Dactylosporangium sp. McL0621 TaxID=3415678 RepID=UPI003CF80D6C
MIAAEAAVRPAGLAETVTETEAAVRPAGLAETEAAVRPAGLAETEAAVRPAGLAETEAAVRPAGLAETETETPARPARAGPEPGRLERRLTELRAEFDRSFADPPRNAVAGHDDLLAIRAGGVRYALRLTQAAGLFPDRPVTRLPGPLGALLGVAGFRGAIVPVYDLAAVLGTGGTPSARPDGEDGPRWLVLAAGLPAVALAFAGLDGHLRVPSDELVEEADGHGPHGCLRGIVPLPDGARPIVDVPAVRAAVRAAVDAVTGPRDRAEER